jgi:hypothetical protein
MSWKITADYFENCNCNVICPCIATPDLHADYEVCHAPMISRIVEGEFDGVRLDGLSFVILIEAPQVMTQGNWRVGYYLDERATGEQRGALEALVTGEAGGPPAFIASMRGEHLGVKWVPIEFEGEGNHWQASVPGLLDFEVESVVTTESGEPVVVENVNHPMAVDGRLPIGKSVKGVMSDADFGLVYENTGRNGHFNRYSWAA